LRSSHRNARNANAIDVYCNREYQIRVKLLIALALMLMAYLVPVNAAYAADPAVEYANGHRAGETAYREGWFGKGDARLHYVEAGKGPLIIFYHGFPSTWFSWFDQMEALKSDYRVVAVDGLGAGLSARPDSLKPYKVRSLARQLDRLARHLNGNRSFILVGHDWGAALAFAYAQAYPERLDAVIGLSAPPYNLFLDLVSTNHEQRAQSGYMQRFRKLTIEGIRTGKLGETIARQSYAGLLASGAITQEENALFVTALSPPETINGGMNWYRANIPPFENITVRDRWPQHNRPIKVPALLLWGNADRTFVPAFLDRMAGYGTCLKIQRFEGKGHWLSMEQPEATNAAIKAFLKNRGC
jgi:epoxide hydrolase 4